ncbi:MAG: hypothetical protein A3I05_03555 [Deltaproteobacteria bacterium RIFCSPLOWO2_02_FULL_44_10]|nr:MAG: hypothetical protein A3C46_03130 [Deltaproteobacteria bacterium RIFCSPHIGHO2_02_FULL_44_16]OGQ46247.1 MAG: hypothetical protein A3I05_03555 [Deltaproteobacteria bacterium RIFCSPLOWO2_02_FULL_44_10]
MRERAQILLAMNNQQQIALLQEILAHTLHELTVLTDGEEAFAHLQQKKTDLLFLDLKLPSLSGYEICRRVKQSSVTRFLPVVITSSLENAEERIKAIELGADDFLRFPLQAKELLARVKSLLHSKFLHNDLDTSESVLFSLVAALEAKDSFTHGHSERVATLSVELGALLGLAERELSYLHRGGLLHDIGKIGIKEAILLKAEGLTDDEFDHIKTHPTKGYDICSRLKSLEPSLAVIRSHHERIDGKGYPDKLTADEIPFMAKIAAVADSFDAMTHNRPYRHAMSAQKALSIFAREKENGQWEPQIVDALLSIKG